MIPSKTNAKWQKLVTGELSYSFKALAAGLMLSRLRREAKGNPDTQTMQRCVDEVYAFFTKYEKLLSEDIVNIFGQEYRNAN